VIQRGGAGLQVGGRFMLARSLGFILGVVGYVCTLWYGMLVYGGLVRLSVNGMRWTLGFTDTPTPRTIELKKKSESAFNRLETMKKKKPSHTEAQAPCPS
jgi:hypothetical protein